jgi:hypothetical protein
MHQEFPHGLDNKSDRKKLSIQLTKNIIDHPLFNQTKKKDDLADCFLQAYTYVPPAHSIREVKARQPTEKMLEKKLLSLPCLKFYLLEQPSVEDKSQFLSSLIITDPIVRKSYKKHYKSLDHLNQAVQEIWNVANDTLRATGDV